MEFCLERCSLEIQLFTYALCCLFLTGVACVLPPNLHFMDCVSTLTQGHYYNYSIGMQNGTVKNTVSCTQMWTIDSNVLSMVWAWTFGMLVVLIDEAVHFNNIFSIDLRQVLLSWEDKLRWIRWSKVALAKNNAERKEFEDACIASTHPINYSIKHLADKEHPVSLLGVPVTSTLQVKLISLFASAASLVAPMLIPVIKIVLQDLFRTMCEESIFGYQLPSSICKAWSGSHGKTG